MDNAHEQLTSRRLATHTAVMVVQRVIIEVCTNELRRRGTHAPAAGTVGREPRAGVLATHDSRTREHLDRNQYQDAPASLR